MTPLEMIAEWRKGCSCAPSEHPEECHECTAALIAALERTFTKESEMKLPQITKEDREFLHYNPNTSDIIEWVQNYARTAVAIEREACARVCEIEGVGHRDGFGQHCAAVIRSQTLITKGE